MKLINARQVPLPSGDEHKVHTECCAAGHCEGGVVLQLDLLMTQLSLRLQVVERGEALLHETRRMIGPETLYVQSNRRGAGGTNFTGG